jgi:hypothetical protein
MAVLGAQKTMVQRKRAPDPLDPLLLSPTWFSGAAWLAAINR